ncbi:MAG: TIGR04282 family arsenosugar biosynthesis glycosyltransferase [Candidatus Rokuibacteriota bacterium]
MAERRAPIAVAIMAKAPRPGEVKTRLCPPLSPAQAADLGRAFLLDKIAQVRALPGVTPAIAFTPEDERALFARLAPGFTLVPQRGDDLGARLHSTLDELLRHGHAAALAIDSDTPTLPSELLEEAVRVSGSRDVDVVLGPTEDGGYYLVGIRAAHRELFDAIPWSTAAVLATTLARARAAGLRTVCLPAWFDVDTPADLERLRAELDATPEGARETRRLLAAWRVS